jgi:hypothetical protein
MKNKNDFESFTKRHCVNIFADKKEKVFITYR